METFLQQKKQKEDFLLNDKKYLCNIKNYYYFCFRCENRIIKVSLNTTNIQKANILKLQLIRSLNMSDEISKKFKIQNGNFGVNTFTDEGEDPKVIKELNDKILNLITEYKKEDKIKKVEFNNENITEKTIKEAFDEYLDYKINVDKIKSSSVKKYNTNYKYLLLFCDEKKLIYTFTKQFFKQMQNKLQKFPVGALKLSKYQNKKYDEIIKDYKNTDYEHLSNKTINEIMRGLSQLFIFFKYEDYIVDNIVEFRVLKIKKDKWKALDDSDISYFLNNCKSKFYKDIFMMGIFTGMRIGEIADLRKEDINFERNYIELSRSKTDAGVRTIPIHRELREIIQHYYDNSIENFLFVKNGNKNILTKNMGRQINKFFTDKLKVFHSTRKSITMKMYEAEQNNKIKETTIRRILGHDTSDNLTFSTYNLNKIQLSVLQDAMDLVEYDYFKPQISSSSTDTDLTF
ncbi:MAG: tyrosine-type recombinase/integrase [Sphaerochaetaceae bacterium]|nr:tyrosine-type recombinase/integrase [Sphaerochaetaceae bacterium]